MALSPNDLLIFQSRSDEIETKPQKKKEQQAVVLPASTQTQPQPPIKQNSAVPQQSVQKLQPVPQSIVQQAQALQKPYGESLPQKQRPAGQPKSAQQSLPIVQAPPIQDIVKHTIGTDMSEDKKRSIFTKVFSGQAAEPEVPASIAKPAEPVEDLITPALVDSALSQSPDETSRMDRGANKKGRMLKQRDSRKLAQRMDCSLHPWRRGYAICNYCGRAFCYEDIMEYGNGYYCLDDIDKVSYAIRRNEVIKYNRLSVISAALFMLSFLVFMYYSYSALTMFVTQTIAAGVPVLTSFKAAQIEFIADTLLALMSFVTSITIILETQNSFRISSFTGLLTVALFSYQYLIDQEGLYIGVIAVLALVGLVSLAYSRVAFDNLPDESQEGFSSGQLELQKSTGF